MAALERLETRRALLEREAQRSGEDGAAVEETMQRTAALEAANNQLRLRMQATRQKRCAPPQLARLALGDLPADGIYDS
jgi:hypothetical protein